MNTLIDTSGMARRLFLTSATVFLSACAVVRAVPVGPIQSRASYEAALREQSTSPAWVLVTLASTGARARSTLCTNGNFLIGAIMRESGAGHTQALEAALDNHDHVFHFTRQAALDNLQPRYSGSELANARALLAPFSASELQHAFSSFDFPVLMPNNIPRQAIACALLERGLSPRSADRSGRIYLAPLRPRAGATTKPAGAN